ncbi:hypothetical protein GCM10017784_35430 [Deinococcus indicus]|uniref:hypothetical protein n=1 Tax=Deinococcus indicus TaxID=223556 RepID=UPI00174AD146|nr:hypothetical protein [Deinococcus indicus]GHG37849.1 hypothetical protein GCM10017784_35430 [Deinococcus indicus]
MLTALTAYFWIMAGLWIWAWIKSLFTPVSTEPLVKDASTENILIATLGGGLALFAFVLLSIPMTYLHAVAFSHMGLPVWLAWLGLAAGLIAAVAALAKNRGIKGDIRPLAIPSLALAWYGLQFLS